MQWEHVRAQSARSVRRAFVDVRWFCRQRVPTRRSIRLWAVVSGIGISIILWLLVLAVGSSVSSDPIQKLLNLSTVRTIHDPRTQPPKDLAAGVAPGVVATLPLNNLPEDLHGPPDPTVIINSAGIAGSAANAPANSRWSSLPQYTLDAPRTEFTDPLFNPGRADFVLQKLLGLNSPPSIWHLLAIVGLSFTPTNLLILTMLASITGGMLYWLMSNTITTRPDASFWSSVAQGLAYGFAIYVALTAGILVIKAEPFTMQSPGDYARLAGTFSVLGFIAGLKPTFMQRLLDSLSVGIAGPSTASHERGTPPTPPVPVDPIAPTPEPKFTIDLPAQVEQLKQELKLKDEQIAKLTKPPSPPD